MASHALASRCQGAVTGPVPSLHAIRLARGVRRAGSAASPAVAAALRRLQVRAVAGDASGDAAPARAASARTAAAAAAGGPTLLWLKRDLRLDDHPGWHAAAAGVSGVVPVFCFDPAQYAHLVLPPGGAEAMCRALASLDGALRRRGSALLLVEGCWDEQLPALAAQLGAGRVLAEQEVEAEWNAGVARVEAALPPGVPVERWSAPLLPAHGDDFRELKKAMPSVNTPLPALETLPALPSTASDATGDGAAVCGLSAARLCQLAAEAYSRQLSPALAPVAVAALRQAAGSASGGSFSEEDSTSSRVIDRLPVPVSSSNSTSTSGTSTSGAGAWEAELAAEIAAGEGPVLTALGRYFRHIETSVESGSSSGSKGDASAAAGDDDAPLQADLAAAIAAFDLPATPDGCFPALFGRALALGVVSKRRIYQEACASLAQQPEQARPAGGNPLAQLSWLLTSSGGAAARAARRRKAAAAAAAAEAKDFHEQMAAGREGMTAHGATLHHWRWRGLLTDYLAAEGAAAAQVAGAAERPAILLCHGFGAFSEHYRANVAALAAAGYDVYSPTLPGYGRAEKPVLPYGQDLWRDFLADFVLQVVRKPVVVAGNSIGGFISASLAADYPGLVSGLVLINSAGRIVPGYTPPSPPARASPPPPFVVNAVSQALFAYLEGGLTQQLRRVYPVRPDRADEWLGGEIARAARDPGALSVFRSLFYLPPPRALNYLVTQRFGGPTLVLQGLKDPLNNAPARAEELGRHCPNVKVVKLDAGHCPHDEVPDQVNAEILRFIERSVLPNSGGGAGGGTAAATRAAIDRRSLRYPSQ